MEEGSRGATWEIFHKDEFSSKKHWHKELEFAYLFSGRLTMCVDQMEWDLAEGELFIISSGAVHYYMEQEEKYQVGIAKISLNLFNSFSKETQTLFSTFYKDALYIAKDDTIKEIFLQVLDILYTKKEVLQESLLAAQFILLTDYLTGHKELIQNRIESKRNSESEVLQRMSQYVSEHYHEKITLTDMAAHLGFSESYCSKYIKKKTNMNFLEYLNSQRIMSAETMLRTTDASVTEIAYAMGFTSIQSFNRVFKIACSMSPSEYRKRLRDKN